MAITFDFLHSFGNFYVFSIEFIICYNHRRVASPKCLICSQSISSRPTALLLFKALTPCRRSSIKNGDVILTLWQFVLASSLFLGRAVCSLCHLEVVGEPPGRQWLYIAAEVLCRLLWACWLFSMPSCCYK